jgi:nicotinate-nucleotide pyrophosphorylase (carboxylating)
MSQGLGERGEPPETREEIDGRRRGGPDARALLRTVMPSIIFKTRAFVKGKIRFDGFSAKTYNRSPMPRICTQALIDRALAEDMPRGDVTTDSLVPRKRRARAVLMAKDRGVLAGLDVFERVFRTLDPKTAIRRFIDDGEAFRSGDILAEVKGAAGVLLKGERTALNFVQRLSGIATATRAYVEAVAGTGVQILDTRKTTPGLRALEKYAVRMGGGRNHRRNLSDMVLIKDNHLAISGGVSEAVKTARAAVGRRILIEVEVETPAEARDAAAAGADWIMLDNMTLAAMRAAVRAVNGRAKIEASGNVRLGNVRRIAETGVDFISVGKLTHSVAAVDLSLEMDPGAR